MKLLDQLVHEVAAEADGQQSAIIRRVMAVIDRRQIVCQYQAVMSKVKKKQTGLRRNLAILKRLNWPYDQEWYYRTLPKKPELQKFVEESMSEVARLLASTKDVRPCGACRVCNHKREE